MTDSTQFSFHELASYIFGSGAVGMVTGALGYFTGRRRSKAEVGLIDATTERTEAESKKLAADADLNLSRMLDQHIKSLLDGYERRVKDLTDEVHALRAEVVHLRKVLDSKQNCPILPEPSIFPDV